MANILSVETSGTLCSLAIYSAGRWFEDTQNVERLHNQVVLAQLDALVQSAGVARNGFDVVAFGAGPGSFTGIRIGAALCQAVAFASAARVLPVSSSQALAAAAAPVLPEGCHRVLTVTRSRRDAYYLAGYQVGENGAPISCQPDRLYQGATVPPDLPDTSWMGTGQRPDWWPDGRGFLDDVQVTALTIGRLALDALSHGNGVAPAEGLPVYVTGDSPWQPSGQ